MALDVLQTPFVKLDTTSTKTATETSPTLTFSLITPHDNDIRPVYLTGNFNNWNPEDNRYRMKRVSKGHFELTFSKAARLPAPLEFKFTRGGWENQELDRYGNATLNHCIECPTAVKKGIVETKVWRWKSYGLHFDPHFLPSIQLISKAFYIPQLAKTRRIQVLLPFDYAQNPQKRYPVLYLQDGQNLFGEATPFGSWRIDRTLAILAERGLGDLIVVAIDHGDEERATEFMSVTHKRSNAEGKKYLQFLAHALKPQIDAKFRTLAGREHTGIGGSSLGGLITIHAGLLFPDTFGRLMVFSPSLWVGTHAIFEQIHFLRLLPTKIYVYAGGRESKTMLPNVAHFREAIEQQGFGGTTIDFKLSIDPKGLHNEKRWGEEFPKAIEWLFFQGY
jgi:predicted alpha/beta superfamily hydrolase